jgi:hypothetical protein
MNERIQELAEQARITISGYTDDNSGYYEPSGSSPEELEKFAELIIKECASICMKNQYEGTPLYNNGSISSAEFIKEHFGVEE